MQTTCLVVLQGTTAVICLAQGAQCQPPPARLLPDGLQVRAGAVHIHLDLQCVGVGAQQVSSSICRQGVGFAQSTRQRVCASVVERAIYIGREREINRETETERCSVLLQSVHMMASCCNDVPGCHPCQHEPAADPSCPCGPCPTRPCPESRRPGASVVAVAVLVAAVTPGVRCCCATTAGVHGVVCGALVVLRTCRNVHVSV
jgi:hypothetical protein